jgi:chromosome segregation ATPase
MPLHLPVRGKLSPFAAQQDAIFMASCAEANLTVDIRKVERRLAQVRDQIGSLERELPALSVARTHDELRVRELETKLASLDAQIEEHGRQNNLGVVGQLTRSWHDVRNALNDLKLRVGPSTKAQVSSKLLQLRRAEGQLDEKLFLLNEAYDDLARQHDARCAAEDREARARAARARALEEIVAGEMPCE